MVQDILYDIISSMYIVSITNSVIRRDNRYSIVLIMKSIPSDIIPLSAHLIDLFVIKHSCGDIMLVYVVICLLACVYACIILITQYSSIVNM